MLSGGQSGPPDDLLHDWREPPVDLAQIDVGNAVPDPHLPCQPCPFLVRVHGVFLSIPLKVERRPHLLRSVQPLALCL